MGICCTSQGTQTGALYQPQRDGEGDEREVKNEGDICIPMADSYKALIENNKIL